MLNSDLESWDMIVKLFLISTFVLMAKAVNPNCELPLKIGDGDGAMERFFFNASSKTCQDFVYRGSGGNENNFQSLSECQTECDINEVQDGKDIEVCKLIICT